MSDKTTQKKICISEKEFQDIAQYFLTGTEKPGDFFHIAADAVIKISERIVFEMLNENNVNLSMESAETESGKANIIELPTAKKW